MSRYQPNEVQNLYSHQNLSRIFTENLCRLTNKLHVLSIQVPGKLELMTKT